jgi:hypothetical protein
VFDDEVQGQSAGETPPEATPADDAQEPMGAAIPPEPAETGASDGALTSEAATEPADEVAPVEEPAEAAAKTGFLSTTLGKVVLIGCAVSLLLSILGVVGFFVFTFLFAEEVVDDLASQIPTPPTGSSAPATSTADGSDGDAAGDGGDVVIGNKDVFIFRDIFQPVMKPSEGETPTASGGASPGGGTSPSTGTTGTSTSQYQSNTLYLLDIGSVNDEAVGTFHWNGLQYTAREGERVDDSPFSVVTVGADTVTVMYGDESRVISRGQGISK